MKKVRALFLALALLSFSHPLYSQVEESRALFAKAYALFSSGDLSQAEDLFLKTLDLDYLLTDYSLYYLGQIALARGSSKTARGFFMFLKNRFPRSVWAPQAYLQLAKISLAEKDYSRALIELGELQSRKNNRAIANEMLYLQAQAHDFQGEFQQAYSLYQELRRASPLSSWAAKARKEVNRLRQERAENFALVSADSLSEEGDLLRQERQYEGAERMYRKLLDVAANDALCSSVLLRLADVYRGARKRDDAASVLNEIVKKYPQSVEAPNALYRLAQTYWNLDDNLKALDRLAELKQRYPNSSFLDSADFISARIYESIGKPVEAIAIYRDFGKKFPRSKLLEEAAWRLAWIYYQQGDYENAHGAFMRLAANTAGDRYKTAALYWQGRTAAKLGLPEEAKGVFLQILNGPDDSYYRGPAARALVKMGEAVKEKKSAVPAPADSVPPFSSDISFHLSRARELERLTLPGLAVAELDEINNRNGDRPLRLLLMRWYSRNGAYSRSASIANELQPVSNELEQYRYPLAYWEKIQKLALERELDPYLVLGLIRQESLFEVRAVSPASAVGLMQLLPSTAARTAKQMGLSSPDPEKLFDPDINLTLGTRHLKDLLERYSNNPVKALAAYNAGENAVNRWEKQFSTDDDEEFIESIPYAETRLYVKLVLRNRLNYRKIYNGQSQSEQK